MKKFSAIVLSVMLMLFLISCGADNKSDAELSVSSNSLGETSGENSSAGEEIDANHADSGEIHADMSLEEPTPQGAEEILDIELDGIEYGTITLSCSFGSENSDEFKFGDGDTLNWRYSLVSEGSTCTITPSKASKYTIAELTAWTLEDDEYEPAYYEFMPWHRLYADGQAEDLAIGDDLVNLPLPTTSHPAYFVFGKNTDMKSPFSGEPCPLELKADGTMYRLDIDFYDESGEYLAGFVQPFFIKWVQ